MNKIYHLSTCNSCKKVLNELSSYDFELQDIKQNHIDGDTLDRLAEEHGSYEVLFNRRAMKYRSMGLKDKDISEKEYRKLILGEYTFLKRPVIIVGDQSFLGYAKKSIEGAKKAMEAQ